MLVEGMELSQEDADAVIELAHSLKVIGDIQSLKPDWNGYGAKPIPKEVTQISRKIVRTLSKQPDIYPTGRRTIQMQYELADKSYLEFEIYVDHIHILEVPKRIYNKAVEADIPVNEHYLLENWVTKFAEGG